MFTKLLIRLGTVGTLLSALLIPIFWVIFSQTAANAAGNSFIDDVRIVTKSNSQCEIIIEGKGDLEVLKPMFYEDPPRLVYDFDTAILRYNKGQTKKIPVGKGDLKEISVAQFQLNPNIVRIVLCFETGDEKTFSGKVDLTSKGGKLVFTYPDSEATKIPATEEPGSVSGGTNIVKKLYHKRISEASDRLILEATKQITEPAVNTTPGWMVFTFNGMQFDLPEGSESEEEFNVPVRGSIVDEIRMANYADAAVLKLKLKESNSESLINYKVNKGKSADMEIILTKGSPGEGGKTENKDSELQSGASVQQKDKESLDNKSSVDLMKKSPEIKTPSSGNDLNDQVLTPEYVEVKRSLEPGKLPNTKKENSSRTAADKNNPVDLKVTLVDDDSNLKTSKKSDNLKIEEVLNTGVGKAIEGNMPIAMLVLFNKQKGSFTLYMLYYQDGSLKIRHYP